MLTCDAMKKRKNLRPSQDAFWFSFVSRMFPLKLALNAALPARITAGIGFFSFDLKLQHSRQK